MKARLIATGERAPAWVAQGFAEYQKRLSHWLPLDLIEIEPGLRGKSSVADYMVIASGTSTRHVKSSADEVVKFAKKLDVMPLGVEGEREAEWVLVDLGDVIVHVMLPRVREFYALERLWTVGDNPPDDHETADYEQR